MIFRCTIHILLVAAIWQVLPSYPALAEVFKYTDAAGNVYYVDSIEKVPEQYRSNSRSSNSFPKIGRVPASDWPDIDSGALAKPRTQKRVEIFVTSWCKYCKQLEAHLIKNKVRYTRYDIERDSAGAKLHRQLGGDGVPLIRVGSKVIQGFELGELDAALR